MQKNFSSGQSNLRQNLQEEKKQIQKIQNQLQKISLKSQDQILVSSQNSKTIQNYPQSQGFLEINRSNIIFEKLALFPGSIQQIDLSISIKDMGIEAISNSIFSLKVKAKCLNQQFNDLDQYVFSVRSNQRYEYFQQVRFKIKGKQKANVKVAVKIPPLKDDLLIQGALQIQLESLLPQTIPIIAKCQIPYLICIKDLYKPDQDTMIIKVPAKKNQIRMPPIPFKNLSNFPYSLQIQAISNENFQNKPYDIIVQSFANCLPNTQFFLNIQLKQNMSYKGSLPSRDTIRKILILKVKNTSIYFNYPLEVCIFEGSSGNSMS